LACGCGIALSKVAPVIIEGFIIEKVIMERKVNLEQICQIAPENGSLRNGSIF
jgi:hypothetical protein